MQLRVLPSRLTTALLQVLVILTWAAAVPHIPVLQFALQQYPGYAVSLLHPTNTSSINEAVQRTLQQRNGAAPAAVLIVLSSSKAGALLVDHPIKADDGLSLAVTTPAAMAAAAAASSELPSAAVGPRLPAADLLLVRCNTSSSQTGAFLIASHAGDVFISGLSVQHCPGSAVDIKDSKSLTVTDTELTGNNLHMGLVKGGAVLANNLQQVALSHVSCIGNFALTKGGCLYLMDLTGALSVTHSRVQHNWKTDPNNGGGGSGIYLENAHQFLISHCDVSHNAALGTGSIGGGISALVVDVGVVEHSVFVNNSAALEGGGFDGRDVHDLHIRESNFTRNGPLPLDHTGVEPENAGSGGAIAVSGGRITATNNINVKMERVRFVGNRAQSGGAVAANQWGIGRGRLQLEHCVFLDNQGSQEAGGVYYDENWGSEITMRRCMFNHNFGPYGGAASLYDSDVTVEDCNFTSNWATSDGGALQLQTNIAAGSGNRLHIIRSSFTNNTSGALGGAVAVDGQALVVENSLITDNYGAVGGGGVSLLSASSAEMIAITLLNNTAGDDGGGAVKLREVGSLNMTDVLMQNNKGVSGGGMVCDRVATITLTNTTIADNTAQEAGGAAVLLQAGSVSWTDSIISNNSAPMGGALAVDSSSVVLRGLTMTHNTAGTAAGQMKQQSAVQQFSALVHVSGTAGAALIQRTSLTLESCTISNNTAQHDAGAMVIQQPAALLFKDTVLEANRALDGVGGGMVIRGTGTAASAQLQGCQFLGNIAAVGSGGALVLDSGLGVLEFSCDGCQFHNNRAGQDGGGIAASGATQFDCIDCHASNNTASHSGGWFYCAGCSNTSIGAGSSSSNNSAAASGGAVHCESCGTFTSQQCNYTSNAAAAGGAVSVQAAAAVNVAQCMFDQNRATPADVTTALAATTGQLQMMNQLPPRWQMLFGVGSAAAAGSVDCSSRGSGGGLCVGAAAAARLADVILTSNEGGTGGALFASAACSNAAEGRTASSGSSSSCQLALVNILFSRNTATEAGGALYSSTPDTINLTPTATVADDGISAAESVAPQSHDQDQQTILLQQLARDNSVSEGGYGPGAASFPAGLSLIDPVLLSDISNAAMSGGVSQSSSGQSGVSNLEQFHSISGAPSHQPQQEGSLGSHGRRLHQIGGQSSSSSSSSEGVQDRLIEMTRNVANKVSSADDASINEGSEFDATCPTLGATVLDPTRVGVDSFQIFSLPVFVLDAFGSRVSSGPGSDWLVALYQPITPGVQLSGAARGRLSSGATVLDGLTLSAPPGNAYNMTLSAVQGQGSGGQPVNTTLHVEVRPCLPGQHAEFANGTTAITATRAAIASSSSNEITCKMCPAPSFSFSAYGNTPASAGMCPACPVKGICVGGMVIPSQGCYQPHPRSATIRACPQIRACVRDFSAMLNLQALQCTNRAMLNPADVDARPFTAMQCSRGYAGPFCSVCYRPGRNPWVSRQWKQQQSAQQQHQQRGYTVAGQPPILAKPWSSFDPEEVYGQSNGRCHRCPHLALAWLGFLLARVFDMVLIALLSLLWLGFGWLLQSPAASAFSQLKGGRFKALTLRHSILGPRASGSGALGSGRQSTMSLNSQQQQQKPLDSQGPATTMTRAPRLPRCSGGSVKSPSKSPQAVSPAAQPSGLHGPLGSRSSAGSMMQSPFLAAAHAAASAHQITAPAGGPMDEHNDQASSQSCGSSRLTLKLPPPLSSIIPNRSGSSSVLPATPTAAPTVRFSSLGTSSVNSWGGSSSSRLLRALGSRTVSRTLTGFYNLSAGPSMRWSAAVSLAHKVPQQQQQQQGNQDGAGGKDEVAAVGARLSALLLMAVQHLACLVQVILDAAQIAAVLLSLDLVYFLPDWAVTGMSAVLITQATTWQWMAIDCLLPGHSAASGAVFEAVLVLLMPVIYSAILFPIMYYVRRRAQQYLNHKTSKQQQQQQQQQQLSAPVASTSSYGSHATGSTGSAAVRIPTAANWLTHHRHPNTDQCLEPIEQPSVAAAAAETDAAAEGADLRQPPPAAAAAAAAIHGAHRVATGHQHRDISFKFADTGLEEPATPTRLEATTEIQQQQQQQQHLASSHHQHLLSLLSRIQLWWRSLWPLSSGSKVLFTSVTVASMAYSFSFYANNLVSAFTCMRLASKPTLPGEIHLIGTYWVPDLQLQCWRGPHAAVAALAVLIGVPVVLGYLFVLLVLAWPERHRHQQQQESPRVAPQAAEATEGVGATAAPVSGHVTAAPAAVTAAAATAATADHTREQDSVLWQPSQFADGMAALLEQRSKSMPASAAVTPTLSDSSLADVQPPVCADHLEIVEADDNLESFGAFATPAGVAAAVAAAAAVPPSGLNTLQAPVMEKDDNLESFGAFGTPAGVAAAVAAAAAVPPSNVNRRHSRTVEDDDNLKSFGAFGTPAAAAAALAAVTPAPPPALNRLHSSPQVLKLARAPLPHRSSVSPSGPSRFVETAPGPVLPPGAAAGTPYAVPMAVRDGMRGPLPPPTPPGAAAGGSGSTSGTSHDAGAQKKGTQLVRWFHKQIRLFVMWFIGVPGRVLEPPVRHCQRHWTQPAGITGVTCAGLGVWNEWCCCWLPARELVKFALIAAAAGSALRAPQVQALVMLLLVILAAALSWRVQAGCSTSMNRMQYAAYCWLQLLMLLVLLMTLQGLNADAYGAVVLGLLVLVLGQCAVLLGCLVWRCCVTARELSEVGLQQNTGTETAVAAAAAVGGKDASAA